MKNFDFPFVERKKKNEILVNIVNADDFKKWLSKQDKKTKAFVEGCGFEGKSGQGLVLRDENGLSQSYLYAVSFPLSYNDGATLAQKVNAEFPSSRIVESTICVDETNLSDLDSENLALGWGMAAYKFDTYKKASTAEKKPFARMLWPKSCDRKRVQAFLEAIYNVRELINIPANDMGPDELEREAKLIAKNHKAKFRVIKDKQLLDQNFPMIYAVGKGSPRRPRLIEIRWGKASHPKLTLVGKGVCFDTGGLDLKPSAFMLTMKKDMGGAAHVLGLAHIIMSLDLPVNLRVLIPAVENSVSGESFRPWDILPTRKGITVEIGNTDAEGRLVLSDAITLACEEKPDLLIDFATLTGAARVALGYDLPAMFANRPENEDKLKKLSFSVNDPVWPLPLFDGYRKDMDSSNADISSTGSGKAGAIEAALYLREFVEKDVEWFHMDVFAWEQSGRPGRSKGGCDTGLRAMYAFIEDRYAQKQKKSKGKRS